MSRHFLELPGANTMKTQQFAVVQARIAEVAERRAMAAVYGEAGLGKTFAVEFATEQVKDLGTLWLQFPSDPSERYVAIKLLRALTGSRLEATLYQLTDAILEILAERPTLLVVDEAQDLKHRAVEYLRHLWDDPESQLAVVFVGGNGCWSVLSRHPMLESRIWRPVAFEPLQPSQVAKIIPRYHGIYEQAVPELIELIDDQFAHGNFRKWAAFSMTAIDLCKKSKQETIDEEIVRRAFFIHGGGSVRRPQRKSAGTKGRSRSGTERSSAQKAARGSGRSKSGDGR